LAGSSVESSAEAPLTTTPYSSLRTLFPHFWLPRISSDGSGTTVFGLYTAGADVLGYHTFTLSADYGPGRNRGYFDLNYQNDWFYPTLFLKAHAEPLLYANLLQRGDYYELNRGVSLGASYPINFLESRYRISAGYQFQEQRALSTMDSNGNFNGVSVFEGRQDNLFAGFSFDNVLKYPYSISSEEGRRISVLYRRFDRGLGSDLDLSKYSIEYQDFLRLPTAALNHQTLYLRFAGAFADGNLNFGQQAFQIGGIPSDLNPYPLRGYPARMVTGKYVATGTFEYRTPLVFPKSDTGTFPLFTKTVHAALFVDAGEVWDDNTNFHGNNVKVGAGVEARMDVTLGYWLKVTPALGFGHGFSPGGENQIYFTVYGDL
jgi:outer membrane protein assembly factor BamA